MNIRPFHIAFPVHDLTLTRQFFTDTLSCTVGRTSERWVDLDLYGHQITAHLVDDTASPAPTNAVDGKSVPASHWGVILDWDQWHQLAERLKAADVEFVIEPYIRFKGEVGEQATLFFKAPGGENYLEFKSFKDDKQIFNTGA